MRILFIILLFNFTVLFAQTPPVVSSDHGNINVTLTDNSASGGYAYDFQSNLCSGSTTRGNVTGGFYYLTPGDSIFGNFTLAANSIVPTDDPTSDSEVDTLTGFQILFMDAYTVTGSTEYGKVTLYTSRFSKEFTFSSYDNDYPNFNLDNNNNTSHTGDYDLVEGESTTYVLKNTCLLYTSDAADD